MTYENLNTESLVSKCADKDPLAWAEFVKRFSPLLRFAIRKSLQKYLSYSSNEDLKDAYQNLLTSLWKNNKLAEIKHRQNINYWLSVVARNAAIDHMKLKGSEVLIDDVSQIENSNAAKSERDVLYKLDADEKLKNIYNLLDTKEKIIFKLYFVKSKTAKDISKMLGIPIGTVSARIARMRKKIKKCSKM